LLEKFIEENLNKDIKSFETTDCLYERYQLYCKFHNLIPITRRKFAFEIRKCNIGARHSFQGKPARWGVRLLPCKY
jgi:hypothetical protein